MIQTNKLTEPPNKDVKYSHRITLSKEVGIKKYKLSQQIPSKLNTIFGIMTSSSRDKIFNTMKVHNATKQCF